MSFGLRCRKLNLEKPSDHDSPTASAVVARHFAPASKAPSHRFERLDPAVLEAARKKLAAYIGPLARIIVGQAASRAHSVEDLYQALAAEIPSTQDREKFLRSRPL